MFNRIGGIRQLGGILLTCGSVLATVVTTGAIDYKILEWKFDKDATGSVPAGFVPGKLNAEAGRWEVANDPKARSLPHVLARLPADQSTKPQIIFIEGLEAGSLDLTLSIKGDAGGNGQGGGVVFRATDESNYYVIWLSPIEKLLRLDKIVNGEVSHLQDLTVESADPAKWHTLRILVHGPLMEAIFDNRLPLSGREELWQFGTYKKGKVGLWAKGTTSMYFDTVRYTDMDESTAANEPFGRGPAPTTPPAPKK